MRQFWVLCFVLLGCGGETLTADEQSGSTPGATTTNPCEGGKSDTECLLRDPACIAGSLLFADGGYQAGCFFKCDEQECPDGYRCVPGFDGRDTCGEEQAFGCYTDLCAKE
ncbi:MAG: hypothetical protein ACOC1F_05465 [Myxococcota bacterium]